MSMRLLKRHVIPFRRAFALPIAARLGAFLTSQRALREIIVSAIFLLGLATPASTHEAPPFVPVLAQDFPDPFVLPHDGVFLAYATNPRSGAVNIQMARSTNLADWELIRDEGKLHDAMPVLPPWARAGDTWAPEVIRTDAGYVLYFAARERESGLQCVGAAASGDPLGPFVSDANEPLMCQRELGGTIDPDPFRDADGQLYLYFKSDGNNPRFKLPARIFAQRLAPDGLHVLGEPKKLLQNDADWKEM